MNSVSRNVIDKFSMDAPPNCPGSRATWYCGAQGQDTHFSDRKFRHGIFRKYPKRYSIELANTYIEIYERENRFKANCALRLLDKTLSEIDFTLALNEEELENRSILLANKCRIISNSISFSKGKIRLLAWIAKDQGIKLPNKNETGLINRLSSSIWWRRNLRKKHRRGLEKAALALNLVSKRKSVYISNESFNCFKQQKKRNSELLKSITAINDLGQEFTLSELSEKSTSNPKVRRAELLVRISGMEQYAKEKAHLGVFFTITCPSRMHSASSRSGNRNPNYDNTTPKEAQKYLDGVWARIRAKLKRSKLSIYGVRVTEPHHDGTPHWHLLNRPPFKPDTL